MARLKHLVVVIPGIGGSVLETCEGAPVWGRRRREYVKAAFGPERLSLAEHPRLCPVALLPSTRVLPWKVVPGYDELVRKLINAFGLSEADIDIAREGVAPKSGASLVLFPYDFRLGVPAAAAQLRDAVDRRLRGLTEGAQRRRVIIIAHSMGGLVARYWLGPCNGAAFCQALITVGTPHRGAPKSLDWLLNGVRLGPAPVASVTSWILSCAADVLREWPSTYHLLPRYQAIRDEATGVERYPHELTTEAGPAFCRRAWDAYGMHREIEDSWRELDDSIRPQTLALFARGHATLSRAVVRDGRVSVTKSDPEWLPNTGWRGDGTVPAISAYPIELAEDPLARRAVPDRHVPMATTTVAVDVLREFEGQSTSAVRGDTPGRPWLGLDMGEVIAAGEPHRLTADLHGSDDTDGATGWLRITTDTDAPTTTVPAIRMTGNGGRWETMVPGLTPGQYRVDVEVVNVPGVDRVTGGDVIGVIEP